MSQDEEFINLEFVDEKLMKARQVGKVVVCLHWRKQLGGGVALTCVRSTR